MTDRTSPLEDVASFVERMNRAAGEWGVEDEAAPAVDVLDRTGEFEVLVDLPGVRKDDVELRLSGRTLHVEADRGTADPDAGGTYRRQERSRGRVERSVDLPAAVDEGAVSATLTDGVLTVTLPRADAGEDVHEIDVE